MTISPAIWMVPLVALALTQIAAIATSVYLHRGLAHRSLRLHPVADAAFANRSDAAGDASSAKRASARSRSSTS